MYDRMNPDINELLKRLENYSKVTYGKNAYELSVAEAKLIVELANEYKNIVREAYGYLQENK
jgi:hypothetical protein